MSGTLKIRDDTTWMPAGWIFDAVLRSIGKELEREDVTLAERLRNAQTDRYGYDDLHTLDSEKFRILQRSAEQAYMLAREQGPQALFDPTSYTSVMIGFSQFKALLRTDFRAKTREGDVAQITIDTDIIWQAPGWLDLVVEHIEAFLRTTNSTLAEVIIGGRSSEGIERCNLQSLTPAQFRLLLEPAEFLFARYGDNKIRDFGAPELLAELAPRIVEFRALLYADPRIANDS